MKTKWIVAKQSGLVPVIMAAVLGCAGLSCSESPFPGDPYEEPEKNVSGIMTEEFWVDREGKVVYALEGFVILEFPEEALTDPTLFTLALFPVDLVEMSGYNMMNYVISLESDASDQKFAKSVQLKLSYCASDFIAGNLAQEEHITIYRILPSVYACSIGECTVECTVDCTWGVICGCINECGFYAVGEK